MFKILHHFTGDEGILREIKELDTENTNWEWTAFGYDPVELSLVTASGTTRTFEEGFLTINKNECTFTYGDNVYTLHNSK